MISMANIASHPAFSGTSGQGIAAERFLRNLPLFRDLPDAAVRNLALSCRSAKFPAGRRMFAEGTPATALYLVRSGWVKLLRASHSGGTLLLDAAGPNTILGETAMLDGGAHLTTAVTVEDVDTLVIAGNVLVSLLGRYPEFWRAFSKEVAAHLREATERQIQMTATIEERIACVFERFAQRFGEREADCIRIPRMFTRQEIAEMVGTTTETAIRTLSRWRKRGILVSEDNSFVILKPEDLAALATRAGWHPQPADAAHAFDSCVAVA